MKASSFVSICASVLIMASCATPLTVSHDYDTTYDFTKLKAYDWTPSQPGSEIEELVAKRWEQAVNKQLQGNGFARSADSPDFLVSLEGVKKTVTAGSTAVGASIHVPVGQHGSVAIGGGKSKPRVKQEGTLTLNITDAKMKSLIWEGSATATVPEKTSPEEQQAMIDQIIAEVLKPFPPKKK